MSIFIGKKIYMMGVATTIVSAVCLSGCNNGNSTQKITVHFSAFSPNGHVKAQILVNGDKSIFTSKDGDSALNFDISVARGEKIDAIFEGLSSSSLSAYASINGVVAKRQEVSPTPQKIAELNLRFTAK